MKLDALASAKALLDEVIGRRPEIDAAVPAARAALDDVPSGRVCACRCRGADDEIVRVQAAVDESLANPVHLIYVEGQR